MRFYSQFWCLLFVAVFPGPLLSLTIEKFKVSLAEKNATSIAGEIVTRVGMCAGTRTLVEIKFPSDLVPLITICHDVATDSTLWSKHIIDGAKLGDVEGGGRRPSFQAGEFYTTINASDCYKKQKETIDLLLNPMPLPSTTQQYSETSSENFLSRGHLAPNGDMIKQAEKQATFYYINASPLWNTIDNGNWKNLEEKLRAIARPAKATLHVWTGTHGIMKMKNEKNQDVEIWLGRDTTGKLVKRLPVNHLRWKVIHHPAKNTGVAIIQLNNPFLSTVPPEDILCNNICNELPWVDWEKTSIVKGYTYCCTVKSFKENFENGPDLGELDLMKSL